MCTTNPRKKASLGESCGEPCIQSDPRLWGNAWRAWKVSSRVSARLLVSLSARILARLFAFAERLPRVSDRIIRMALRKTLRNSFFFTRELYQRIKNICCRGHPGTRLCLQGLKRSETSPWLLSLQVLIILSPNTTATLFEDIFYFFTFFQKDRNAFSGHFSLFHFILERP